MGKMGQSLEREGDPLALSRIDSVKLSETAGASFEDSLGGARKPGPERGSRPRSVAPISGAFAQLSLQFMACVIETRAD